MGDERKKSPVCGIAYVVKRMSVNSITFTHMDEWNPTMKWNIVGSQFLDSNMKCLCRFTDVRLQSRLSIRILEYFFIKGISYSGPISIHHFPKNGSVINTL
jgi:hypothetical protein